MATTDENKAARTEQSREVARDAAEAYRAAVGDVLDRMTRNKEATALLAVLPMTRGEYQEKRQALRVQARELVRDARGLGIERTKTAEQLGVSRQTIHEWLNEGGIVSDTVNGAEGLPGLWTDLANGATRGQVENLLSVQAAVTVYLEGEPVAVLLTVEEYLSLKAAQDFLS